MVGITCIKTAEGDLGYLVIGRNRTIRRCRTAIP
jgi:hypothetical protein